MKYILQWTLSSTIPFKLWGHGQDEFIRRKCKVNKCFVTPDRWFWNITEFDLVAFHGPEIEPRHKSLRKRVNVLSSKHRSTNQKYVFVSIESSHNYPVCNKKFDGYFNWTWTYKLDSDVPYEYIAVKNIHGDFIGPKQNMKWIDVDLMEPVNDTLRERLKTKNKTVVWFASNCNALSKRQEFAEQLHFELKKYNLNLHVFGDCGKHKCPRDKMKDCLKMIERDYYFYLALENSFADDYVTEKLLWALQYYAIPVVFGGANYTRGWTPVENSMSSANCTRRGRRILIVLHPQACTRFVHLRQLS
ncbi:hypothetical protein MSG28_004247 [Choristoneura fumiferana]|uniref:Uncharacterized protein n=1 Tax=Choristoneura fumiferana TaxID=7141 RepID=A0ACC0KI33_CHOFU|nr:hypothetical protein MSG28_004247 [Choristoneura fumiferana]